MMGDEKIFVTPRGGLVRLFGLPRGFTLNRCGSRQKEISDQAHPLPCQTEKSKMPILAKNSEKNLIFEIVAEICDRKCCRNFWQHDGNPPIPKCPETQFYEILYIIRRVTNF